MTIRMTTVLSTLMICMLLPFTAMAEVAESYKCKTNPGVSRQQIADMGTSYIEVGRAKGYDDFHLTLQFPMYAADMSNGTFYWNGTSPTMATMEEAIAIWVSAENSEALSMWVELVQDCESASLYSSIPIS
ncbi:MAG: hypothetical protein V7700_16790 [Halioglobus sp.]